MCLKNTLIVESLRISFNSLIVGLFLIVLFSALLYFSTRIRSLFTARLYWLGVIVCLCVPLVGLLISLYYFYVDLTNIENCVTYLHKKPFTQDLGVLMDKVLDSYWNENE